MPTPRHDIGLVLATFVAVSGMLSGVVVLWSITLLLYPHVLPTWLWAAVWLAAAGSAWMYLLSTDRTARSIVVAGCLVGGIEWMLLGFSSWWIAPQLSREVDDALARSGAMGAAGIAVATSMNEDVCRVSFVLSIACWAGAIMYRRRARNGSSDAPVQVDGH